MRKKSPTFKFLLEKMIVVMFFTTIPILVFSQEIDKTSTDFSFTIEKTKTIGFSNSSIELYVFLEEKYFSRDNMQKLFAYFSKLHTNDVLLVRVFTDKEMLLWYEKGTRANFGYVVTEEGKKAEKEFYEKAYPPTTGYFSAFYTRNDIRESFYYSPLKDKGPFVTVILRDNSKFVKSDEFLLNAVKYGYLEAVKRSIAQGQKLDVKDEEGDTPLSWAVWLYHNEIAKLLITSKADVNTIDLKSNTPLMNAVFAGNYEGVKLLIDGKANINKVNDEGKTALIISASNCNIKITEFLLKNGADTRIKDKNGKTARISACNNTEIIKLLS